MSMSDSESWDEFRDEEEVPLSQSTGRKAKHSSEYRIKGALKVPHLVSYTAQSLFEQMHSGDIDLNAEYQRDVVWPDSKQMGLIDSYFRNYFVPPVVFVVRREDDGAEKRVCIDGKQRLTSIWRFMDGLIPYKDPYTGEKFTFKDKGKSKSNIKLLPERYMKIFRNKQIACMEYDQLSDDDEREIFQRVQLGMALTPAEKMQAVNSPTATFIRELAREFVTDGLGDLLEWDTSRGSDFRGLTTAVYAIQKWKSITTTPSPAQLTAFLQQHEDIEDSFRNRVRQTLSIFVALARDEEHQKAFHLAKAKKVAPVEFMMTCVLISAFKDKLTMAQLSEAILELRKDVRKVEQDIRMNGRIVKHMLNFIKALKPLSLKPDPGHPMAAHAITITRKKRPKIEDDSSETEVQEAKKSKLSNLRVKASPSQAESTLSQSVTQSMELKESKGASQSLPRPLSRASQPVASTFKPTSVEVISTVASQSLNPEIHSSHPPPLKDRLAAIKAAKGNGSSISSASTFAFSEDHERPQRSSSKNQKQALGGSLMERMQIPSENGSLYYQGDSNSNSKWHHSEKPKGQGWKGYKR